MRKATTSAFVLAAVFLWGGLAHALDSRATLPNGEVIAAGESVKCGKLITITSSAADGSVLWFVRDDVDYEIINSKVKLATPCRNMDIRIDIVEIDWESRQVTGQSTKVLTVRCDDGPVPPKPPTPPDPPLPPGPGPDPPDPGPVPPPDGPFDGIAAKVFKASAGATAAERANCAAVLNEAADGMDFPLKFVRIEDVRAYIARNWPSTCVPCMAAYKVIKDDAGTRGYSWQDAQAYYREVAKGVNP